MEHKGTQILETERLILRPFAMEDAPAMYANWASDDEVTKYLTWPTHASVAVTEQVIRSWVERYQDPSFYQWMIVLKADPRDSIGAISVVNQIDDRIQLAHVGYCIGRKWWHQGITSEAFKRVISFLFDEVGVLKVEARHDPRNPHSGAVMRKCGLKPEGTLRQSGWNNQGICDECYYGLLASERT